ncbi:hypothetical protein KZZ52_45500 [Dactylosporangium sp. AC04546]|uniref:hypothetical protein n=1 Tax=Dactylosporangium sp. AC04546 TaxID=2862460 RepID=UPI001EE003FD|nr:hypothetical protein [Dactylosporangium sp. AC04546]WVK81173.1 hypothetical protein KZZ52_45500 [Dactylosporangium sp. AC04546]
MNCRTQVVLAAGIGYLLGRQHKLRWGLMLAAAAATGRLSRPGGVLQHGVRALGSSEELHKLGEMGGPLVAATKDAAKAAVTGRLGSVTDRLRERTEGLHGEDREEERPRRREPRDEERPRRRAPRDADEPRDEEDEYEERDDYDEAEEEEPEPMMAGARSRSRPPVRRRGTSR